MRQLIIAFVMVLIGLAGQTRANPFDELYDEAELASVQPIYERAMLANYNGVIHVFNAEERARLAGVRFVMRRRATGREPFGFFASGNNTVMVSTASMKFLADMMLAMTWLNGKRI
jgi:hypothetical protein